MGGGYICIYTCVCVCVCVCVCTYIQTYTYIYMGSWDVVRWDFSCIIYVCLCLCVCVGSWTWLDETPVAETIAGLRALVPNTLTP
jgi:hypothetical protein